MPSGCAWLVPVKIVRESAARWRRLGHACRGWDFHHEALEIALAAERDARRTGHAHTREIVGDSDAERSAEQVHGELAAFGRAAGPGRCRSGCAGAGAARERDAAAAFPHHELDLLAADASEL